MGVLEVIGTFGPFAKFLVEDTGGSESTASRCEGEFNRSPVMCAEKKPAATPFLSVDARSNGGLRGGGVSEVSIETPFGYYFLKFIDKKQRITTVI